MQKLTLFAMTERGWAVAQALVNGFPGLVQAIVASKDRGIANDCYGELADFCRAKSIPFHDRRASHVPETPYSLASSWRWLISPGSSRLIVLHDSLLPRYRGFNPLVTALINGDQEIGVTALYATGEYDRGHIISQSAARITYPITIGAALQIVARHSATLALGIGDCLNRDIDPAATPQDETQASYSLWRDETDYFIDWNRTAAEIKRFIDAVGSPYKGAATRVGDRILRILHAEALEDVNVANRTPGKVIFMHGVEPVVVCGRGLLKIKELRDDLSGDSALPLPRFRTRFSTR